MLVMSVFKLGSVAGCMELMKFKILKILNHKRTLHVGVKRDRYSIVYSSVFSQPVGHETFSLGRHTEKKIINV